MDRYLPLPQPPRSISKSDETRIAVHKNVRGLIRRIADLHNRKISDVIWNAVIDHWLVRVGRLHELSILMSTDPNLNDDKRSYIGRCVADAKEWDKKPSTERASLLLAEAGYNLKAHE